MQRFSEALAARSWDRALARVERLDPNARNATGWTPLMLAALHDAPVTLVDALLAAGADLQAGIPYVGGPLHVAVRRGSRLALHLADAGADLDALFPGVGSPLGEALARGHEELAVALVERGAPLHLPPGRTSVLPVAAAVSSLATVSRLLASLPEGPARQDHATRALKAAARRGDPTITRLLLEAGAAPDGEGAAGPSPLHEAAAGGFPDVVRALLDAGARVDRPDELGRSPLLRAVADVRLSEEALLPVVEALLAAGADPALAATSGETPETAARASARVRVLRRLAPGAELDPEWAAIRTITLAEGEHDVFFRPNDDRSAFVLVSGHWHDRMGGGFTAREALTGQRDFFVRAGLEWFLPFLERLAGGERLRLQDLEKAFARHHGRPLPLQPPPQAEPRRSAARGSARARARERTRGGPGRRRRRG